MARRYTGTSADVTGAAMGAGTEMTNFRDFLEAGYAVSGEAITVPASPDADGKYRVVLDMQPKVGTLTVTRTSGAVVLTLVAADATPTGNQVAVDWQKGVLRFPAAQAGAAHTADYTGNGTPTVAHRMNQLQKDVEVLNTGAVKGAGSSTAGNLVSFLDTTGKKGEDSGLAKVDVATASRLLTRNPRVLYVSTAGSDTDGNGSVGYPYASVTKAMAVMSGTTVIMLGPGSFAAATVSNSGTEPVDLTPATAVVLVGVPGLTTVTLSGEEAGAGVYNCLKISGASGVIFARTGTGNRHAVCGLDRMIGLRDCELTNSDGSRKLTVFGRTGESAAVRGLKVSGSAPAMIELYNVWLQDCWIESAAAFNVLQWTGEAANRISDSWIGIATSGALRIEGLASANDLWFDGPDVDSFSVTLESADDVAVYRSIQGRLGCASSASTGGVSLFAWNANSGDVPAVLEGWDVEWTGLFAEPADGGKVMILSRFSGTKEIVVRNSRLVGTCIPIFNSHPNTAIDANRGTEDRPLTIDNSYLAMTRAATTGPADVNGALLNYGRGVFRSVGSTYRAIMAASTNAATHYAAVYLSPPNAGTMAGTLVNDRFEVTLPAGTVTVGGATSNEKAAINVQNTYTTMAVRFVNPSISVDGNQDSVFAGHGSTYVTVEGLVSCNAAVTFENAPAGSYQAARGNLAVSALTTTGGAAAGYRALGDAGTTLIPASDCVLTFAPSGDTRTLTLASATAGQHFWAKNLEGSAESLAFDGGNIDGAAASSYSPIGAGVTIHLLCVGGTDFITVND